MAAYDRFEEPTNNSTDFCNSHLNYVKYYRMYAKNKPCLTAVRQIAKIIKLMFL